MKIGEARPHLNLGTYKLQFEDHVVPSNPRKLIDDAGREWFEFLKRVALLTVLKVASEHSTIAQAAYWISFGLLALPYVNQARRLKLYRHLGEKDLGVPVWLNTHGLRIAGFVIALLIILVANTIVTRLADALTAGH